MVFVLVQKMQVVPAALGETEFLVLVGDNVALVLVRFRFGAIFATAEIHKAQRLTTVALATGTFIVLRKVILDLVVCKEPVQLILRLVFFVANHVAHLVVRLTLLAPVAIKTQNS